MLSVRATVAEVFYVPTGVVAPEIPRGSRVLVYKLGSTYEPGQIVAYRAGAVTLLGRVVKISPTGEIVAQALTEEDEVVSYDCDLDLGQYIKNTIFNFDAHRRIEHYGLITEQTGVIPAPEN